MANPWFRMYAEFATDAKVQSMSEAMQRRLMMLFCLRCSDVLATLQEDELAFAMRLNSDELAETKALFVRKGFTDSEWNLLNWDKRQFNSDSSVERVRRHREKRKASGLVAQLAIPPEVRAHVYKRDDHQCVYCGSKDDLTLDHAVPESRGGAPVDPCNLLTACRPCNASKRDLDAHEYAARIGDETLPQRIDNALDKKHNRTEEANASVGSADKSPRCDTNSVVSLYHEILPELPAVRLMNDNRRKAVSAFWRFVLTSKKSDGTPRATDAVQAMEWIRGYFTRARDNDFLMGRGNKAQGHEGWQCDFDFLLTEKGKKHVIEKTREAA